MSNTVLTIDMVTKEALRIAHEKATFLSTVNRSFDDSYAKAGAKIGDTLRIRNPNQYTRRQGSRIMSVQDQAETSQNLTVATQDGVDMKFNSAELALSIDEFSTRYIEPAMSVLVSGIEGDLIATATKDTFNVAGTAGTVVGTVTSGFSDTSALGIARAKLNQGLAPKDGNRSCQFDSITMASVANGIKGLFLPQDQVKTAFTEGFIARTAMADFYENERTYVLACGSDHTTVTVNATSTVTDGGNTLDITGGGGVLAVGDVFTVAGVYACHPETKAPYAHLQQFVVVTGTNGALTISPPTNLGATAATLAKRNICTSAGAACTATTFNSAVVTVIGGDSAILRQNLMYHKDAFAFVTADLPLMADAAKCSRMTQDGFSLRVWQGSDIRNDELLMRIDILYGFKTVRPYWSCRITN